MSQELVTVISEAKTLVTNANGVIKNGQFQVTGNWDLVFHLTDNNGREWDSPILSLSDGTVTFNPPPES